MATSWLARLGRRGKTLLGVPGPAATAAAELYARAVRQARQPTFYAAMGVPDTHDGRLELVQLHVILLLRRLQRGDAEAQAVGQALFDAMFDDLDRSLREGGVGDLSVGKWVKSIARQFYARATAVEGALEGRNREQLVRILETNVRAAGGAVDARALADYALATDAALGAAVAGATDPLAALHFPPVAAMQPGSHEVPVVASAG